MGCTESKKVSKQPGTSVVTDDTYLDEYVDNVSDDRFVNSGNKTQENGRVINNNEEMAYKYSGNNKHNTITANGYANKQPISASNQRTQHVTVISSSKPGYGKRNVKASSNTQNITNLVDIEEYEDFSGHEVKSNEKPVAYLDEYAVNVSDDCFVNSGNTTQENGRVINNNDKMANRYSGNNKHNIITANGYANKQTISASNQRTQHVTVISSSKPGYGKRNVKASSNTQNITNLVDIEEYEDFSGHEVKSNEKPVASTILNDTIHENNNKPENKTTIKESTPKHNSDTFPKVIKPVNGIKRPTKPVSTNTKNITGVVDLEDYDYSDNQTINSVTKSSDDGHVLNNKNTKDNYKSYVKEQVNSITVISSNKPVYGAQKTKKIASSNTDSITNLVDLEEYD